MADKDLPVVAQSQARYLPENSLEVLPESYVQAFPSGAQAQPTAPGAYLQQMPAMDQYKAVCVQLREARFVATNDLAALQAALPPPPPACLPGPSPAARPRGRRWRLPLAQTAAWVCALQLGVIIWILTGHPLQIDVASLRALKESVGWPQSIPGLNVLWDSSKQISAADSAAGGETKTSKLSRKNRKKQKAGKIAHQQKPLADFAWPIVKNFVPPPPPSVPSGSFVVPPPPVAYSLTDNVGPGAVAASTLPPPPAHTVKKTGALKEDSSAVAKPLANLGVTEETAVSESHPLISAPKLPSAPAEELPPLAMPMPTASPPMPVLAPAISQPAPVSGARTVMSGNRKRVIADR